MASGGPDADTIAEMRSLLASVHSTMETRFNAGVPTTELIAQRATAVDALLESAWRMFDLHCSHDLALVAVGGYGRGELHPYSDVDILILLRHDADDSALAESLRELVTLLWDVGLELGHSVRTVAQCVEQSAADVTVATNLMEARLICGEHDLFKEMLECTGPGAIWPSREFFDAKRKEQIARHSRFDDTAYNLEPNVKEGPGGLRDIHMIEWVAKRHLDASDLADLVTQGFLTPDEQQSLSDGRTFLWQVRFALHMLTNRREDRLLFDHQRTIAARFGYRDDDANLAVEQFMQRYYRTIMELSRLNEMLLALFEEAFLSRDGLDNVVAINRRFCARAGFLETATEGVFRRYPFALLELFLIMQQHPELRGVRASTIRQVRNHLHIINDKFRADIRSRSLFIELLKQPRYITREFKRMHRYGVLGAYLPDFDAVVGQMQYDLFHVYTVDEHSLKVLSNTRAYAVAEKREEHPELTALFERLPKPELLYIAGLFHDIAKGQGGDHSELGADAATGFCNDHGFSEYDSRLVTWLVRHHLLMSTTSQRQDITDPDVINEFARRVGGKNRLDYLYLLTVADIRGTNPTLWNSWKQTLLRDLYSATLRALRRGLENPIDRPALIAETQAQALKKLAEPELAKVLWSSFGDDYFLRSTADEIAWHSQAILSSSIGDQEPLVLVRHGRGGLEIFLYALDRKYLFAAASSALGRMGLNIHDARIITSDTGMTLDSYIVMDLEPVATGTEQRLSAIAQGLKHAVVSPGSQRSKLDTRLPKRELKHFDTRTQINFSEDWANKRTVMEVITRDRPGLLGKIGWALADCGLRLQNAKITTFGERAEDIFFIADQQDQPLAEQSLVAIEAALHDALST